MSEQWQKPIGIEPAIFPADQAPEPVAWRYRYNEHSEWKYTNTPVEGVVPYCYWQEPLYAAPPNLAALRARQAVLVEALTKIVAWEFPETGKMWPDGTPVSYGAAFGSNGQRDYMREIARAALAQGEGG